MNTSALLHRKHIFWILPGIGLLLITSCQVFKPVLKALSSGPRVPSDVNNHYPLTAGHRYDCVDFHNHITLKPFCQYIDDSVKLWQAGSALYNQKAWALNPAELNNKQAGKFSTIANYRQSNWQQLKNYKLVCTSLYELERGLAFDNTPKYQQNKRLLSEITTGMSHKRCTQIITNRRISPYAELRQEYAFACAQQRSVPQATN